MILKKFLLVFILGIVGLAVDAQKLTPEEYIETYKDIAIREMRRMGVPAAITLAQGLLESESGNSILVKKSNNHFGIKCKSNWTAESVNHDDDAPGECFRVYGTADESYRDHSNFLRNGQRYSFLFNLKPTDYKGWAHGLKKAGYATNPKYPAILIRNIEQYNLQQYSLTGASEEFGMEIENAEVEPIVFDKNQTIQQETSVIHVSHSLPPDTKAGNEPGEWNTGKVFSINGSRCIYAKSGTSLLAIASQYNISLKKLLAINELEEDGILVEDQLIFLQKKPVKGEKDFVIVQKKQTLYDVAQSNGIQLERLLVYNQLNEDGDVYAGTKLYLKAMAETDQAVTIQRSATAAKATIYQVQPREGLYTVAKKHGVTVQQLKEWNNLTSDNLQIGQQLIVQK